MCAILLHPRLCWLLLPFLFSAPDLLRAQNPKADPASPGAKIVHRDDVVYGQVHGAGLLADIAYPESKEKLPAIISVHGGRWKGGHKRDGSTIKVDQWASFGFFAMSIDYRLVGCSPAPACYQDFQCAIRYVHAHADELNVDPKRIFLIGPLSGIKRKRSAPASFIEIGNKYRLPVCMHLGTNVTYSQTFPTVSAHCSNS